jgi:hypothetical protein
VARYEGARKGADAEIAVVVDDTLQHRGVGRLLLGRLVDIARENGFTTLTAEVLTGNRAMLGLMRALRLPQRIVRDVEVTTVVTDLTALDRRARCVQCAGLRRKPLVVPLRVVTAFDRTQDHPVGEVGLGKSGPTSGSSSSRVSTSTASSSCRVQRVVLRPCGERVRRSVAQCAASLSSVRGDVMGSPGCCSGRSATRCCITRTARSRTSAPTPGARADACSLPPHIPERRLGSTEPAAPSGVATSSSHRIGDDR